MDRIPLIAGAITWAGTNIEDNVVAIAGITLLLVAAFILKPFDSANMFALTMSGIAGISALAGYEIGKRQM